MCLTMMIELQPLPSIRKSINLFTFSGLHGFSAIQLIFSSRDSLCRFFGRETVTQLFGFMGEASCGQKILAATVSDAEDN